MNSNLHSWLRLSPILLLLAVTAVLLHARNRPEVIPQHPDLQSFPMQVGNWRGENVLLDERTLQTLGPGEFLSRVYEGVPRKTYSSLFIAYFPSQRMGDTIHSPKNCIPGAGWTPVESTAISLPATNGQSINVNRYVIAKGLDRQLVLYWYQSHGRVTPSEYWAKIYLVTDSVRLNRSDGALVRVITPIAEGESIALAEKRAVQFSQQIFPLVSSYIPR